MKIREQCNSAIIDHITLYKPSRSKTGIEGNPFKFVGAKGCQQEYCLVPVLSLCSIVYHITSHQNLSDQPQICKMEGMKDETRVDTIIHVVK